MMTSMMLAAEKSNDVVVDSTLRPFNPPSRICDWFERRRRVSFSTLFRPFSLWISRAPEARA